MSENAEFPQDSFPQESQENIEPKKKRTGKNSVSALIPAIVWLSTIFFVGMVLGNLLWLIMADILAFDRGNMAVEFIVSENDTLKDVSIHLKQQGLISYPGLFRLYSKLTGKAQKIHPGTYALNTRYDYPALIKALSAGIVQRHIPTHLLPS
jgi:cell division protein YceG involved in septum cleavage